MTRFRIYADEDSMSRVLVKTLRKHGEDVRTANEEGMLGRDDEAQLKFAIREGRSIYTCNAGDFARLHSIYLSRGQQHPGIIVCPFQKWSASEQARRLRKLIKSRAAEDMVDALEYLSAWC